MEPLSLSLNADTPSSTTSKKGIKSHWKLISHINTGLRSPIKKHRLTYQSTQLPNKKTQTNRVDMKIGFFLSQHQDRHYLRVKGEKIFLRK